MKKLLFFALFLWLQIHLAGQPLLQGVPEEVGMSSEKLKMIDAMTQKYIQEEKFPGGVILVARRGLIVYYKSFGYRTPEKKAAYKNNDIFRIASMSKAITTVGIMQLYERGLLDLDDPVDKYIPAFRKTRVLDFINIADSTYTTTPVIIPITIRHLLTHTSGITYGDYESEEAKFIYKKLGLVNVGLSDTRWTTEQFINQLALAPLAFQPGEKYSYGLNMDVLGRVIEVVSGQSLANYLRKSIFDPLKMDDTWFYLPKEKRDRLVPLYAHDKDDKLYITNSSGMIPLVDYPKMDDNNHYAGGGGLSSTAMDYARFIQALLNGGQLDGKRILSRSTIQMMTSDQMIALNKKGNGFSKIPGYTYCLGFSLITEAAEGMSLKSPGTFEWGGYFDTKFFIDPEEELIFVGMDNITPNNHDYFWDRITALVYGAIED
ncbi:MAG TPA: serine hydrolase domain-containing protein [Anaerovoracaceae bacterium]|nr:serine hydrolase domain-containing protein [Anaerovoracaceae bacterium]